MPGAQHAETRGTKLRCPFKLANMFAFLCFFFDLGFLGSFTFQLAPWGSELVGFFCWRPLEILTKGCFVAPGQVIVQISMLSFGTSSGPNSWFRAPRKEQRLAQTAVFGGLRPWSPKSTQATSLGDPVRNAAIPHPARGPRAVGSMSVCCAVSCFALGWAELCCAVLWRGVFCVCVVLCCWCV